jgi:Proteobacterial transcriptional regulator-like domain
MTGTTRRADGAPEPSLSDWHRRETYEWTKTLPRNALGWEFLRRSPAYRAASKPAATTPPPKETVTIAGIDADAGAPIRGHDAAVWGLLQPRKSRSRRKKR